MSKTTEVIKGNENWIIAILGIILSTLTGYYMWFKNRKTEKVKTYFIQLRDVENKSIERDDNIERQIKEREEKWDTQHATCCAARVVELNKIYETIKKGTVETKDYLNKVVLGEIINASFKDHEKRISHIEQNQEKIIQMNDSIEFMKSLVIRKFGD
jgi:hypothetical protein